MLNIPVNEVHNYDEIESIDEAADILGWTEEGQENKRKYSFKNFGKKRSNNL